MLKENHLGFPVSLPPLQVKFETILQMVPKKIKSPPNWSRAANIRPNSTEQNHRQNHSHRGLVAIMTPLPFLGRDHWPSYWDQNEKGREWHRRMVKNVFRNYQRMAHRRMDKNMFRNYQRKLWLIEICRWSTVPPPLAAHWSPCPVTWSPPSMSLVPASSSTISCLETN